MVLIVGEVFFSVFIFFIKSLHYSDIYGRLWDEQVQLQALLDEIEKEVEYDDERNLKRIMLKNVNLRKT